MIELDKITLIILTAISFITFVGGCLLGIFIHKIGLFIMLIGMVLTLYSGKEFGKIIKDMNQVQCKEV